jgi:hypothetical protein
MMSTAGARHPQMFAGADDMIADAALQEFTDQPTDVGLVELARFRPDPYRGAERINRIHEAFDIPVRVRPRTAEKFLRASAIFGIEAIRSATESEATETGIVIPAHLTSHE